MKFLIAAAIASTIALVSATCPNLCSGHGNCGSSDRCTCYANWQGADCSERICPYGFAWVDAPSTSGTNFAHWYAECSNKGICDRSTGMCNCFAGYEGKGCKRQSCPNSCSGHGRCYFIEELTTLPFPAASLRNNGPRHIVDWSNAYGQGQGAYQKAISLDSAPYYYGWDTSKQQGCVCDAGYEGADCSLRQCPRGDNVLTVNTAPAAFVQTITIASTGDFVAAADEIVLTFTTLEGAAYTTTPIKVTGTLDVTQIGNNIQTALTSLPNHAIPTVTVSVTRNAGVSLVIAVTFSDAATTGVQNPLQVGFTGCRRAGCAPYYLGVQGTAATTGVTASIAVNAPTSESAICSEHGVCDTATGLCKCFHGYYDLNCNEQTVLV